MIEKTIICQTFDSIPIHFNANYIRFNVEKNPQLLKMDDFIGLKSKIRFFHILK